MKSDYQKERQHYLSGFVAALILTAIPFALVSQDLGGRAIVMFAIGMTAILQIMAHLRYFLHIDFNQRNREDLYLILFTTLVMLIMILGTIWILSSQMRMMG